MKYREDISYKDSGIKWLGKLPSHWEVKKIKHTSYVKGRIGWQGLRSEEFIDQGPFLVTGTDFENGGINWGKCYHVSEERYNEAPPIQLEENDLLITKDGTIGKLAMVLNKPAKAILNSGIFVTRPLQNQYYSKFLYWVLSSKVFKEFFNYHEAGSTIKHLYQETFLNFSYPLPSKSEQLAIVNFLDKNCGIIDLIIQEKRNQISLLQQYRQSLITETVTRGLDSDVPMRDSSVEWIGKIPSTWEVSKIKNVTNQVTVGVVVTPSKYYIEGSDGVPCLRSLNVKEGKISDDNLVFISKKSNDLLQKSKIYEGDLVSIRTGDTGVTSVVPQQYNGANCIDLIIIRKTEKMNSKYLCYLLNSNLAKQQYRSLSGGAIQQHFNIERAKNTVILNPPIEEQNEIAEFLNIKTAELDALIKKSEEQIRVLGKYRQSLIHEVVTGKIDVRELEVETCSSRQTS